MSSAVTPKLLVYVGFAGAVIVAAVVARAPALAAVGTPFAAYVALALSTARTPRLDVRFRLAHERVVEGDEIGATLELAAPDATCEVELLHALPAGVELADGSRQAILRVRAGEARAVPLRLRTPRWGSFPVGATATRLGDRFGLVAREAYLEPTVALRVYPRLAQLRRLVRPWTTQPYVGNRVARARGEGIEFADIRPFAAGDRIRRVNWRASGKRGELYVNESHPERNSDIVLFLDAYADVRRDGRGTFDLAVRAAASLASEYLESRDRVGVVGLGDRLRWIGPSLGARHFYRIVETLLDSAAAQSLASFRIVDPFRPIGEALAEAWTAADVLPPRSLPPDALVIALTPLLDERSARTLLDVHARGFDLAVVELSPLPFAPPPESRLDRLALRLWPLRRDVVRSHFERLGIGVVQWTEERPLSAAIEEVSAFRRFARRASA